MGIYPISLNVFTLIRKMSSYQEVFDIEFKEKSDIVKFIIYVYRLIHPCKVINNSKCES